MICIRRSVIILRLFRAQCSNNALPARWARFYSSVSPTAPATATTPTTTTAIQRSGLKRHPRSANTDIEFKAGTPLPQASLISEYDAAIRKLIADHTDVFRSHFNAPRASPSALEKLAINSLNAPHHTVRDSRAWLYLNDGDGHDFDVGLYNNFLRHLYPLSARPGKNIFRDLTSLYNAYLSLPSPAPRNMEPAHLEDLISVLMSGPSSKMLLKVLSDVVECGMPVSPRELASAFHLLTQEASRGTPRYIPLLLHQISQAIPYVVRPDITLYNTMLVASQHPPFVANKQFVAQEAKNITPNRFTLMSAAIVAGVIKKDTAAVKTIRKHFNTMGFALDTSAINMFIKCYLSCGLHDEAESIFRTVFLDKKEKIQSIVSDPELSSTARNRLMLMDHLNAILKSHHVSVPKHQYLLPLYPDSSSFALFVYHYSQTSSFEKLWTLLRLMRASGQPFTSDVFKTIFKIGDWTVSELNRLTNLLLLFSNNPGSELLTNRMARLILHSYEMALPEESSRMQQLYSSTFLHSNSDPQVHTDTDTETDHIIHPTSITLTNDNDTTNPNNHYNNNTCTTSENSIPRFQPSYTKVAAFLKELTKL